MGKQFLLSKQADERCYWFRIGVDAAGSETVEIYDDVVGTPTFVLPADAATLNLIREGLRECCFFISEGRGWQTEIDKPKAPAAEIEPVVETRSWMEIQKDQHARAYQPWTDEEDEELLFQWRETQNSEVLAAHFGRNAGAISARARKLGLTD